MLGFDALGRLALGQAPAGAQSLLPALYADVDAIHVPTLAASYTLAPALYSDADAFAAPGIAVGPVFFAPSLYSDADAFHAPAVAAATAPQTLTPALYSDPDAIPAPVAALLETLVPDSDISDGNWTASDLVSELYTLIDESAADDGDWIRSGMASADASADTTEIRLSNPITVPQMPFSVAYRYRKRGDTAATLFVQLMEGATERASWTREVDQDSFMEAEEFLTSVQFAAITDFSDLRIRFTAQRP
jgi:hypothetical protein